MTLSLKKILNLISIVWMFEISAEANKMIRIIHPDIDSYYLEMLHSFAGNTNAKFWKLSKEEKRQACISSIQTYSFQVVDDDKAILESSKIDKCITIQEINKYYDTSILNSVKYTSVAAVVRNLILAVNAHLCQLTPEVKSFLTQGDAPGTYIALRRDHGPFYKIEGLLEPVPEVTLARKANEKYVIDNSFVQNKEKFIPSKTVPESICEKTDLQRARLCCAVYVAYQQNKGQPVESMNALKGGHHCLKKALIILEPEEGTKETFKTDLVPCFVGEKLSTPLFYLADDPYSSSGVYLLHQTNSIGDHSTEKKDESEPSVSKFRLELYFQKVTK